MANLSHTTRDHEEIRRWAEERGGKPAHVKRTGSEEDIGMLRIEFPGFGGDENLEPISWEDFFAKFDERGLALIYQEETAGGQRSNFNKLVSAETAAESDRSRGRSARSGASRRSSGGATGSTSRKAAKKGATKKKATVVSSGRGPSRAKTARKASAKKPSEKKTSAKKTASRKSAAKKSSSRSASGRSAGKRAAGAKSSRTRSAAKRRK